QVRELRRRLHMILKTRPIFRSGKAGAMAALGLGLILPFSVARSQDEPSERPPTPPNGQRRDDDQPAERRRERAVEAQRRSEAEQDDWAGLRAELEQARAQLAQAQAVVEKLKARMAQLGEQVGPDRPAAVRGMSGGGLGGRVDDEVRAKADAVREQLKK